MAMATWENATTIDLVTATTSEVLECYNGPHDDSVNLAGATTSSSYFRIIRAASGEGHNGTPSSGVSFTPATSNPFQCNENNASIQDLIITQSVNDAGGTAGITLNNAGNSAIGCIVKAVNAGGTGHGVYSAATGVSVYVINCLLYECTTNGALTDAGTMYVYNTSAIGNGSRGFTHDAALTVKNCLASGNGIAGINATTQVTCASSDASATAYPSQTFTFVAAASDDYHLHRNDLGATFRGTDLSADATFPFNDDIDGDTITNWNIGMDSSSVAQSSLRTGDNENISTYAASGADYDDLAVWENDTTLNLVSLARTEVLECEAGIYNDTTSLTGATTDGRYFRIIRPAPGHEHGGLPGSGVEFVATSLTSNCVIQINENFSKVQGISVATTLTSASTNFGFQFGGSCDYGEIVGCIATVGNVGAGGGNGFGVATSSDRCRIANSLAYDCKTAGFAANGTSVNQVWTNNTSIGSPTGFVKGVNASVIAINNLADDNATAGYSGTYATGSTTNASGKADAPGTSNRNSQTFTFTDLLAPDYHLTFEDVGALGFGTNMAANNWFNFNDDVDVATVSVWSIGFDSDAAEPEPPATGNGGGFIYLRRRRRQ